MADFRNAQPVWICSFAFFADLFRWKRTRKGEWDGFICLGKDLFIWERERGVTWSDGVFRIDFASMIEEINRNDFSLLSWPYLPNVSGESLTEETIFP